jgi:hypothetical protein
LPQQVVEGGGVILRGVDANLGLRVHGLEIPTPLPVGRSRYASTHNEQGTAIPPVDKCRAALTLSPARDARMKRTDHPHRRTSRISIAIVAALVMLPLLLLAHVPLLAAVPGALLTAASINALDSSHAGDPESGPSTELVDPADLGERARIDRAEAVEANSRRVS